MPVTQYSEGSIRVGGTRIMAYCRVRAVWVKNALMVDN
jgi:hypothetical protein